MKTNVYFIQDSSSGMIKIGQSQNPVKRLSELQVSCPGDLSIIGIIPNVCDCEEGKLHETFSYANAKGEWFKPDEKLISYIRMQSLQDVSSGAKNVYVPTIIPNDETNKMISAIAAAFRKSKPCVISMRELLNEVSDAGINTNSQTLGLILKKYRLVLKRKHTSSGQVYTLDWNKVILLGIDPSKVPDTDSLVII